MKTRATIIPVVLSHTPKGKRIEYRITHIVIGTKQKAYEFFCYYNYVLYIYTWSSFKFLSATRPHNRFDPQFFSAIIKINGVFLS